jgi:hypothetical protein
MVVKVQGDVLREILKPGEGTLPPELAEYLLTLRFNDARLARVKELAEKSNDGTLTPSEREEFESYVFLGDLLALIHSKARLSLKNHQSAA